MSNDIHVDCLSCSQNQCPQDGVGVSNRLLGGGQNILCFASQLEGVGGIQIIAHVFLKLASDV